MRSLIRPVFNVAIVALFSLALTSRSAFAERWPTLEQFVERAVVIVDAVQTGDFDDQLRKGHFQLRVTETWKGRFDASEFECVTSGGLLRLVNDEHGFKLTGARQRVIVSFGPRRARDGKFTRHSTAFPVNDGKIIYASSSDDESNPPTEMSVDEFKARVRAAAARHAATTRSR